MAAEGSWSGRLIVRGATLESPKWVGEGEASDPRVEGKAVVRGSGGRGAERATVERGNVRRTAHPDVGHEALDAVADAEAERVRVDELARAVPQQVIPLGDHMDLRRRQKVLIRHLSEGLRGK